MTTSLLASTLLLATAQSGFEGPQFTMMGGMIFKIDRGAEGPGLRFFNGMNWEEGFIARGNMRCVYVSYFFLCTSNPNADSTVITPYNRPTGKAWEPAPKRLAEAGPFTPLLYGTPLKSSRLFGTVGAGDAAKLAFFEGKRRNLVIASPEFKVKGGWRSMLMVEDASGILNTPGGLKEVHLQGDDSGFRATLGGALPEVESGYATDSQGNALLGAPMGNMFFFVDKKGQLGQFFRSSSQKWVYANQETPPRGWTVSAKSRPVTVTNGQLAVQVEHKDKGLEGVAISSFKGGDWHWSPQILELPQGVKFDGKVDLTTSSVGTDYHVICGVGEDGRFYRFKRSLGTSWAAEGGV